MIALTLMLMCVQAQEKPVYSATDRVYVGINYSPDGTELAVSGNEFVDVLDAGKYRVSDHLQFRGLVDEAVFDPKMRTLVIRGKLIDTLFLDTSGWERMKLLVRRGGPTHEASPGLDSTATLSNGYSGPSSTWSAQRWLKFAEYPVGSCPAAWSSDGRWLAVANGHIGVRICDTTTVWTRQHEIVEYPDFSGGLVEHANALLFHRRYLFVGEEHGAITPLPLRQWEDLAGLGAREEPVFKASVIKRDHEAYRRHAGHITSLSMTPDGLTFVSGALDEKVSLWTLDQLVAPAAATPEWTVKGHYAALDREGRLLAVAEDGGIRGYDLERRRELFWIPVDPRTGRVVRLRWNPNGSALAAISCVCEYCVPRKGDDVSLASYKPKPRRVHQHGGALQIWSMPAIGTDPH